MLVTNATGLAIRGLARSFTLCDYFHRNVIETVSTVFCIEERDFMQIQFGNAQPLVQFGGDKSPKNIKKLERFN